MGAGLLFAVARDATRGPAGTDAGGFLGGALIDAGAAQFAELVLLAIAALKLPHPASPVAPFLTVSVGVASLMPDGHMTAETLLISADEALYRSKAAGRNRVTCQTPLPVPLRLVS